MTRPRPSREALVRRAPFLLFLLLQLVYAGRFPVSSGADECAEAAAPDAGDPFAIDLSGLCDGIGTVGLKAAQGAMALEWLLVDVVVGLTFLVWAATRPTARAAA